MKNGLKSMVESRDEISTSIKIIKSGYTGLFFVSEKNKISSAASLKTDWKEPEMVIS